MKTADGMVTSCLTLPHTRVLRWTNFRPWSSTCEPDWAGRTRPREQPLRARGEVGLDPERGSRRRNESRVHDRVRCVALVADHEGGGPALDERLVRAVCSRLTVRVVGGYLAGLDDHNHDAWVEMPTGAAVRLEGDRLHQHIRRILGLELDPILVHVNAVCERGAVAQDRRGDQSSRIGERDRRSQSGDDRACAEDEDELSVELHCVLQYGVDLWRLVVSRAPQRRG